MLGTGPDPGQQVMSQFCDCASDGWCQRYQRNMSGRFREICAGVNCDLGTAAAFREQWQRETGESTVSSPAREPIRLLLKTDQAPGDAVAMTAAIYSLHKAHPGKYLTAVESPYPEVFAYNPDVVPAESIPDALPLHMHYPAIHQSNQRAIHFMQGWCEFLGMALGIHVPLLTNRPHLYFDTSVTDSYYWIVCAGGKRDLTNKIWGYENYREVARLLVKEINFIQVGAEGDDHISLGPCNVNNMIGQTNLRQLFDLVRRARGVLCGVSLLMHVAAALERPAVIIAGGREPVAWNAYPRQHYLHTVGMLPCSDPMGNIGGACWRSRTVALGDGTLLDQHTCQRPVGSTPECMTMIKPEYVADLIRSYGHGYWPKESLYPGIYNPYHEDHESAGK